eukprot:1660827-Amphidinium_carterae.1
MLGFGCQWGDMRPCDGKDVIALRRAHKMNQQGSTEPPKRCFMGHPFTATMTFKLLLLTVRLDKAAETLIPASRRSCAE